MKQLKSDSQQQQYGTCFKPDRKLCLIIGNYDYSELRDHLNKGFPDLKDAKKDVDFFEKKILQFGFDPKDVKKVEQIKLKEMQKQMKDYRDIL